MFDFSTAGIIITLLIGLVLIELGALLLLGEEAGRGA